MKTADERSIRAESAFDNRENLINAIAESIAAMMYCELNGTSDCEKDKISEKKGA